MLGGRKKEIVPKIYKICRIEVSMHHRYNCRLVKKSNSSFQTAPRPEALRNMTVCQRKTDMAGEKSLCLPLSSQQFCILKINFVL